jgi:hypothetical protein
LPYGIAKSRGGDSLKNVARVEACVKAVMAKGNRDRVSAIKICKAQLFGPETRKP